MTLRLARDPYDDPTPCGGADKEIVRETVNESRATGVSRSNPGTASFSAAQHPTRPAISRENAICPKRLLSAATIVSEKVGPGQYRVQSRTRRNRVYDIDVYSDQPCDCEDSEFGHGRMCAHWLHCRMREGDELTLLALGQVILRAKRVLAEYLGTEEPS